MLSQQRTSVGREERVIKYSRSRIIKTVVVLHTEPHTITTTPTATRPNEPLEPGMSPTHGHATAVNLAPTEFVSCIYSYTIRVHF
jgi:hypothetical protein